MLSKRKKFGFTMIELLAVIVILSVLALLVIPLVGNLIKQARINAAVVSAYGYVEATNNEVVNRETKGEFIPETLYNIENFRVEDDALVVKYEGRGPSNGWFNLSRSKVLAGEFCINGYDIKYEDGKASYVKDGNICPGDDSNIIEPEPEDPPIPPTFVRYLCEPDEEGNILEYDPDQEYSVNKVNDLVCLSKLVRNGNDFSGAYVKMISDVDFNNDEDYVDPEDKTLYGDFNANSTVETLKTELTNRSGSNSYGFYPIGVTTEKKFAGNFDGDGHMISNLYIKRTSLGEATLFSSLDTDGIIENLTMKDVYINGNFTFGAVVGYNYGTIRKVNVDNATLTGNNNNIAGITGSMENGYIIGCNVKNVTINGASQLGGIVGYSKYSTIKAVNIYDSTIKGVSGSTRKLIGGIIGYSEYNKILEAAVHATIEGYTFIGGAVGSYYKGEVETDTIKSVYIDASITATTGKAGGFLGANAGNVRVVGIFDGSKISAKTNYGVVGATGTATNPIVYFNSSTTIGGTLYDSVYTTFDNSNHNNLEYFSRLDYDNTFPILETDKTGDVNNSGYWFAYDEAGNIIVTEAKKVKPVIVVKKLNNLCLGTEFFNPTTNYSIEDVEDLICLSEKVATGIDFEGTNIYFTKDIDFNNNNSYSKGATTTYKDYNNNGTVSNIKTELTTGAGFPIVGSSTKPFKGNIYGQGHTISNLRIVRETEDNVGLFGYIASEGNVGGFYLNNANVEGKTYVGSIAGKSDGTISSVRILSSNINGLNYVGGIVGTGDGAIKESEVKSTITSSGEYAGGVIGYLPTTKDDALNDIVGVLINSTITAADYAGGVSGAGYANKLYIIIDGGTITGTGGKASKIIYDGGYKTEGVLYANSSVSLSSGSIDNTKKAPNIYDYNRQVIMLFDDVLDTWIGGDTDDSEFYFDFETDNNNNVILKHVEDDTFEIKLSGKGTASNPYLLKNESDFKQASLLLKGFNYFKINNDINLSNFKHFYGFGTYNNYFNGNIDGNNKTISNLNMYGGRYAGFIGYANEATISNLKFSNGYIAPIYNASSKSIVGISIGEATNSTINNIELNNNTINGISSFAGIFAGEATGTINGVKVRDISIIAYDGVGSLIGHFGQDSIATNVDISIPNYKLTAHDYVGGIGGLVESPIKYSNINLDSLYVKGRNYVGGMFGKVDNGTAGYAIVNNLEIEGKEYIGGGAGIVGENGTLQSLGLFNLNIHGEETFSFAADAGVVHNTINTVGGAAGENNGIINEIYVSGTIDESTYSGGLVGKNVGTNTKAIGSVTNMNLINCYNCGGYIGYNDSSATFNGVVDGGKIEYNDNGNLIGGTSRESYSAIGNYDIGNTNYHVFLSDNSSEYNNVGYVYISNSFSKPSANDSKNVFKISTGLDGYEFTKSKHFFALYDDVVDTWFGGDNDDSGFYFDFENDNSDNVILKQVNDHSFDVTLSGAGTSSNPYLLSTEKDFRDAALYLRRGYYFKIASDIDVSTFKHFYNLGTYGNYFNGYLNGNNKTIDNMTIIGGRYTGFSYYQNGGKIENLNFNHPNVTTAKYDVNHYTDCTGDEACAFTTLGVVLGYGNNAVDTNIRISNATINDEVSDTAGIFAGVFTGTSGTSGKASKIFVDNSTIVVDADVGGMIGTLSRATLQTASFERTNHIKSTGNAAAGIVATNAGIIDEAYAGGKIEGFNASGISFYLYINTRSSQYGRITSSVVDAEIVGKSAANGFIDQGFIWTGYSQVRGVITPRTTITAENAAEVSTKKTFTGSDGDVVYVSENTTVTNTKTYPYQEQYKDHGAIYKNNYHLMGMFDDVLDTPYGGDNNNTGYYFDFENDNSNNVVLKSLTEYPLTITLSGAGTESNPYVLTTEKDFKDAAVICKQNKYFAINSNIDISSFKHFYQLGTYSNYFNGIINGNNNTISNMHLNGGRYAGLVGYLYGGTVSNIKLVDSDVIDIFGQTAYVGSVFGNAMGSVSNIYANNVSVDSSRGGSYAGGFAGYLSDGTFSGLELTNNFSITGNQHVGGFVGTASGVTLQDIKVNLYNKTITGASYVGGFAGSLSSTLSLSNSNLDNITVIASGDYAGGFAGALSGTMSNITINNPSVTGKNYTGGFAGTISGSTTALSYISNITVNNPTVTSIYTSGGYVGGFAGQSGTSSYTYVSGEGYNYNNTAVITYINVNGGIVDAKGGGNFGGLSGINYAALKSSNVDGTTITSNGSGNIGGIAGTNYGSISEVSAKATISNGYRCGGIVGTLSYNSIKNAFAKGDITCSSVGGIVGYSSMTDTFKARYPIYAVVESGTLTGTNSVDKAAGFAYTGEIHVSNSVTSNMDGTYNGITYASTLDKNLSYYGNLTYDVIVDEETTTYPILDSAYTGDINETGYWFKLNSNNDIKVVPVEGDNLCPDGVNTPPCPSPSIQTVVNESNVCTTGDTEPPECTLHSVVPVLHGLRANFSCTDNAGAPLMASMFNATTSATYSYDEILAPGRGSQKTGTVNGNTRSWVGSWTTTGDLENPPQPGLCYYYQFAAKDECGNSKAWVSSSCYSFYEN